MPWYNQGTVDVTANSATVTGTGTAFSANARVGDAFRGPDGRWYEITNIASASVISISPAYQGDTATGQTYAIAPMQGYVKESADRLRQLVDQFGSQLAALQPWATSPTAAAAREALGTNDAANLTAGLLSAARVPATLTPDKAFRRGNILGTVSHADGVPTGAIIERGSNANGEYIRWADGTQICWSRRVRNATTNPGQSKSVDVTTAAGFVGEYETFADGTFYSGADATGQALYALPLKVEIGRYIWNQGTSPSEVDFAFSVGSLVALSSLESVLHIGRWH
ncbi:hypothetical protein [Stutzerimonas stutzeri]|uniref:Tail fiber domain-containing protein n=1 Tax=Stutzerimonas stutzeri TaxID=316 RepID=A0AA42P5V6_STUST|nr:hypothetical protein [Stutzerimonas stutzeri]MDH1234498.1 hypothetical protein [Stutzerimonas stutzeri]